MQLGAAYKGVPGFFDNYLTMTELRPMKILQLCNKPPLPVVDGGTMGMHNMMQGMAAAGATVRILSVESDKHPAQFDLMPEAYKQATRFEAVYIDLSIRKLDAAVCLLTGESYNVKRFISNAFHRRLAAILQEEEFDVVQVESIFLAPYLPTIRKYSQARVVLSAPNVEHEIWRGHARQCKQPLKRWYLKHLALSLGAYEREMAPRFDGVLCFTERDADFFRALGCRKVLVRPIGIDLQEPIPQHAVQPFSLYHLGSMDWKANVDSIEWFLDKVWPKLHQQLPQVTLHLAGRNMPDNLLQANMEGVEIQGQVPDAYQYISDKQINIVPLLYGSGIRVKIIESMAAGKAVVSTRVGAAGIEYSDGENILLADTAAEFVERIGRLVRDQNFCEQMGKNARRLIETRYDNARLTQEMLAFYAGLTPKRGVTSQR